ncbi:MAG: hypothetical protein QG604_169 [Candidatus Dependentiae bacterium]|nr:hypothetical protein [Candidatus Dependentiae bacterium]
MPLTLVILRPFIQDKKEIDWVSLECPGGSFLVGPGHRPLVNMLAGESTITYAAGGREETIEVPEEGGLVHVVDNQVILFLN